MIWLTLTTIEEFRRLSELERRVYPLDDCITGEDYMDYCHEGNIVRVLSSKDKNWIGNFQVSHILPQIPTPVPDSSRYITGIAVFSGYQGQGYGDVIMLKLLAEYGQYYLVSRARIDNRRSINLLRKHDFGTLGTELRDSICWEWFGRKSLAEK